MVDETRRTGAGGGARDDAVGGDAGAAGSGEESREAAGEGASEERGGRSRGGWTGLSDLQEVVSEVVDSALRGFGPVTGGRFPRHDLVRVPGEGYRVLLDLPGVRKGDLEVSTVGDELTVSGERRRPDLPEGSEVLRAERGYGRFRRTMRMPPDVDVGEIRARLEDGVLRVTLPRRGGPEPQTIEVES